MFLGRKFRRNMLFLSSDKISLFYPEDGGIIKERDPFTFKMETICCSETLVPIYQTT
jgi:hypothetical protein